MFVPISFIKERNLGRKFLSLYFQDMILLTGISPCHLIFCQILIVHFIIRSSEVGTGDRILYLFNVSG